MSGPGSILVLPEDELSKRLLWDDWLLSWQRLTDGGPAIDWVLIFHATTKQLLIVVSKCAWPTESRNPSFCQYLNAEKIQHSSLVCTQQHKVEPMNNAGWYNVILSLMVARSWMVQMFRKTEYPRFSLFFVKKMVNINLTPQKKPILQLRLLFRLRHGKLIRNLCYQAFLTLSPWAQYPSGCVLFHDHTSQLV